MRKLLITAVLAALPAAAIADEMAEKTVEARQGYYKLLGANMHILAGMAKGDIAYDGARAQTAADNLMTLTQYNLGHLYTPGTSSEDVKGSDALPKIWNDFAGVQEKGMAFVAAVEELNAMAGLDRASLGKAVQQVGGACKGCHDNYRAKD
ncbi:putative c'cytochrome [Rhodovulum sp. P5]|uniref:c-type cytochrome n=1 Tax=Rhodovulum sp. P5 TaxID=1564506 RepID=UPI0009C32BD4|nr:cytochrome c [Rhodovulum sp. P5]ARE38909.1 putative c'cytochrome [Rhodovulum sp. P5]